MSIHTDKVIAAIRALPDTLTEADVVATLDAVLSDTPSDQRSRILCAAFDQYNREIRDAVTIRLYNFEGTMH